MKETSIFLINKDLFLNLSEYYCKTGEDILDNIPLTFLIKHGTQDDSFKKFTEYCSDKENNKSWYWIIKPGENSNRGQGIELWGKIEQIK